MRNCAARAENKRLLASVISKKSDGVLRRRDATTFHLIKDYHEHLPVPLLCATLEVSYAGFYAWREQPTKSQEQRRDALGTQIRAIQVKAATEARIHAELTARAKPLVPIQWRNGCENRASA